MSQSENPPRQENLESNMLNIVLLGQAGTGKSASGNTILGTTCFKSHTKPVPVTREFQVGQRKIFGTEVRVIDTPDFFFHECVKNSQKHVKDCIKLCGDGSSVYLLVIQIGRFTEGKRGILEQLEEAFKSEIREKTIVLFTFGEQLTNNTFDEFIKDDDPYLKEMLHLCGNRSHVFRNTSIDYQQVVQLMKKISMLPGHEEMFPALQDRGTMNTISKCINMAMYYIRLCKLHVLQQLSEIFG